MGPILPPALCPPHLHLFATSSLCEWDESPCWTQAGESLWPMRTLTAMAPGLEEHSLLDLPAELLCLHRTSFKHLPGRAGPQGMGESGAGPHNGQLTSGW
jgi:hypothetical protein